MMPRKFTNDQIQQALAMRLRGEKWSVVEMVIGEGIKGACDYLRTHKPVPGFCNCNQGRLPCSCNPDAWMVQCDDKPITTTLSEQSANDMLRLLPGATKHPLFMRQPT